jgi:hypothetical protein
MTLISKLCPACDGDGCDRCLDGWKLTLTSPHVNRRNPKGSGKPHDNETRTETMNATSTDHSNGAYRFYYSAGRHSYREGYAFPLAGAPCAVHAHPERREAWMQGFGAGEADEADTAAREAAIAANIEARRNRAAKVRAVAKYRKEDF